MKKAVGLPQVELRRLKLQAELDAEKSAAERNRLGQFATPTGLALDIAQYAVEQLPKRESLHFLDPAIGTGAFYSALVRAVPKKRIAEAVGFEIDPHYQKPATKLWARSRLKIKAGDFTRQKPEPRFNLIICNPPYVRHHHLSNEDKARLQHKTIEASAMRLSGLAGLYCHFLGQSHTWLAPGGIGGWLIPSEFMDVNYGQAVRQYLLSKVTLLHIHRFDPADVQFADALVSSAVVWFRNETPPPNHAVRFTFGGTLHAPTVSKSVASAELERESKWSRFPASDVRVTGTDALLSDFFKVKRGLATGDNKFFILSRAEIAARHLPIEVFRPILPSARYIPDDVIEADRNGWPVIERQLFVLDSKLDQGEIQTRYPTLAAYLADGIAAGMNERYLCAHRKPWYSQENRPAAPIVCTYIGRGDTKSGRPFRFLLNESQATVSNVYLAMYPTPLLAKALGADPTLLRRVWEALNRITPDRLLAEGRVYGGGMHKLEPRELSNLPVPEIAAMLYSGDRAAAGIEAQPDLFAAVTQRRAAGAASDRRQSQ